jgi:hypothetical protein
MTNGVRSLEELQICSADTKPGKELFEKFWRRFHYRCRTKTFDIY